MAHAAMWEPHTSTVGKMKGPLVQLEIVKEADPQLGSRINGGAIEKCVLQPLIFHLLSGLNQCLSWHG